VGWFRCVAGSGFTHAALLAGSALIAAPLQGTPEDAAVKSPPDAEQSSWLFVDVEAAPEVLPDVDPVEGPGDQGGSGGR
jgi:hypothetical protein